MRTVTAQEVQAAAQSPALARTIAELINDTLARKHADAMMDAMLLETFIPAIKTESAALAA